MASARFSSLKSNQAAVGSLKCGRLEVTDALVTSAVNQLASGTVSGNLAVDSGFADGTYEAFFIRIGNVVHMTGTITINTPSTESKLAHIDLSSFTSPALALTGTDAQCAGIVVHGAPANTLAKNGSGTIIGVGTTAYFSWASSDSADLDTGIVGAFTLSYRPNSSVAVPAGEQVVVDAGATFDA